MFFKSWVILFLVFLWSFYGFSKEKESPREVQPVLNRDYLPVLLDLINSSQKSIYICHFLWNPDATTNKIKSALYQAINRGVEVKVLLEDSLKQNDSIIKEFSELQISIKTDTETTWPNNLLHTKLIIVDEQKVLLGSTNLSYKSINENNETNFLINSSTIANFYKTYFENLWNNTTEAHGLKPIKTQQIIATVNRDYFSLMKEYVRKSKKRVALVFYGMKVYPDEDNEVMSFIEQLIAAKKRGVNVMVLLEKSSYDDKLNEGNQSAINYLKKHGINAKFESPDKITHAKLILVDNQAVGVGSANFALSGFRFYNEVNAISTYPEIIKSFWDYFESIWKTAKQ